MGSGSRVGQEMCLARLEGAPFQRWWWVRSGGCPGTKARPWTKWSKDEKGSGFYSTDICQQQNVHFPHKRADPNLEVTSTPNITLREMFHKVIWFVLVEFTDFSDCHWGSERNMFWYGNCCLFFCFVLFCFDSSDIATHPASIRTSWLQVSSQ